MVGGKRIECIIPIGLRPIVDFEVPGPHNYIAGGVVHHNSGKSTATCYEATCHAIGFYPSWWSGYRYDRPVTVWACGEDAKAVRESLQPKLLGYPFTEMGTGLIPGANILGEPTKRSGTPEAVDALNVKHASGGTSRIVFKMYEQGRESFQASKIDIGICDEEPPHPVYSELLARTMATVPGQDNGHVLCGFTPLLGWSSVVMMFLGTKPLETK